MTESTQEIVDGFVKRMEGRRTELVEEGEAIEREIEELDRLLEVTKTPAGKAMVEATEKMRKRSAPNPRPPRPPKPEPAVVDDKRQALIEALEKAKDGPPLSTAEVARAAGVDGRGTHGILKALKQQSIVAEPEEGEWLSTKAPRYTR